MVVKRIISCLAMASVMLLASCYEVKLDKETVTNVDWAYGITDPAVVIERMPVTVEPVISETKAGETTATETNCEVEVSWECPYDTDDWSVYVSDTGNDDDYDPLIVPESKGVTGSTSITILKTPCYTVDATVYYTYSFKCNWVIVNEINYIGYFKIMMPSANPGDYYSTITSFVVFPDGRTLRVTVNSADANALSDVYYNLSAGPLFTNVKKGQVPASPAERNLGEYRLAYFSILTDLSSIGLSGNIRHYSNSSYCKVKKISTAPVVLSDGRTVEATLQYEFEDLPCNLRGYEPNQRFDYNDVVMTVDIIN